MNSRLGKVLYGILFCALLPFLLVLWASNVALTLLVGDWRLAGWLSLIAGLGLMAWAMLNLWKKGKGLPMNAYPPIHFVNAGAYQLFRHPIYVGFCAACAGVSILAKSPAGLYLITPIVILLCWALIIGFESPDIKKRFGNQSHYPFFGLPPSAFEKATINEKFGAALLLFGSWGILYELVIFLGISTNSFDTFFSFEKNWPVIPWTVVLYVIIYPFTFSTPFVCKTKKELRDFGFTASLAIGIGIFLQFVLPLYASPKKILSTGIFESLIAIEKSIDGPAGAFPSFHVLWAFVAAQGWSIFLGRWKWVGYALAGLISWSCLTIGVHSIADVASAILLSLIILYKEIIWAKIQKVSEKIANSWHAWNIKGLRIINHSLYAGLAGLVGIALASLFINDGIILITITFCTLVGGAAWGWWIEGSSLLLRPFGYYGALIGGLVGVLLCQLFFHFSIANSLVVFALASPATQGIGRLRCLVQGCCHGKISESGNGIVYRNEHSRVCRISGLKGKIIHNTPLYSIISNFVIGLILWRLWYGDADAMLIVGLYFILSGAARFVEEQYRGEAQTKTIYGLPIYQWLAIVSIIFGAVVSTLPSDASLKISTDWNAQKLLAVAVAFIMSAFAMGMDFPKSKAPFSQLTG
jgi:protein-S-isoprenylcysteine O-methyltransferase Ste14